MRFTDVPMSVLGFCVTFFALLVFLDLTSSAALCPFPQPRAHATLISKNTNFTVGDYAIYECESGEGRFGVIPVKCQDNGQWSTDHRECTDASPLDSGCISGIVFATITAVTTIFSIIFSTLLAQVEEG